MKLSEAIEKIEHVEERLLVQPTPQILQAIHDFVFWAEAVKEFAEIIAD